jgi:surface protein
MDDDDDDDDVVGIDVISSRRPTTSTRNPNAVLRGLFEDDEIVIHILSFIEPSQLVMKRLVNKRWKKLSESALDHQGKKAFTDHDELQDAVLG